MKILIQNIQTLLDNITGIKYIDADWGQLDYYSPNFPVKFPCVLLDVTNVRYSDIGTDKKVVPINRQEASATLSLTIADLKLSNTSSRAPQPQKDNAFSLYEIIAEIHALVQGFKPDEKAGSLIRTGMQRVKRDDGVQEYIITYGFALYNV